MFLTAIFYTLAFFPDRLSHMKSPSLREILGVSRLITYK